MARLDVKRSSRIATGNVANGRVSGHCFYRRATPGAATSQAGSETTAYSNAKMRFQSSFMLTTIQPCFLAMSYISWLKVPTDVFGNPCAGP